MNRRRIQAIFIWALLAHASPTWAVPFTGIDVFGDSLSDTGNLFTFCSNDPACGTYPVGFPLSDPTNPFLPGVYDNGRFSNGPVWVEYLALALGLPAPTPSNLGGTNYAWGGAETGSGISGQGTPNIGTQVAAFLTGDVPRSDTLYVLWAGANDFINAGAPPDPATLVSNIAASITSLATAAPGENLHLLVPNLPPLGETPRLVDTPFRGPLNALSVQFNTLLGAELRQLEVDLGITIAELDTFALTQSVLADPAAFGLSNVTDTARLPDGVDVTIPGTAVVANPDEYLFFDDIHPTTVFHRLLAAQARLAVPEPASLLLVALGLVALAANRRRRLEES